MAGGSVLNLKCPGFPGKILKNMKKIKRPILALAVIFAAVCFVLCSFAPKLLMPPFVRQQTLEDKTALTVVGKVYKTETKTYSVYVYLKNTRAALSDGEYLNAGRVLLLIPTDEYDDYGIKIGNTVSAECLYDEFGSARNNGNYDEEVYFKSLGIFLKVSADSVEITDSSVSYPAQPLSVLRERIVESFTEILGEDESALIGIFSAIVTGDKSFLTDGTKSLYQENGIAHILAISGLHISLIGMGLFSVLKKYTGPKAAGIISSAVMVLYCIMCGLSVSSLRAVIMFIIRMAAYFFGKTYDTLSSVSLAAVIILASDPFYILNSGFILSFMAIFSVSIVNRTVTDFLKPERKLVKTLISGLSVTVVSLPVIAGLYYEIPVYGFLLNIIVIPLMGIVLGSGLAGGLFGIFFTVPGRFFIGLGVYTVYFINLCCYAVSLLPLSSIVTGAVRTGKIFLFYLILCASLLAMRFICMKERKNDEKEYKNN